MPPNNQSIEPILPVPPANPAAGPVSSPQTGSAGSAQTNSPRPEPGAKAGQNPAPGTSPSLGSILIVEDDRLLRELLMEKLTRAGFSPRQAIDGEQALAAVKAQTPDLILLDLVLPGMDGFQILREVRSQPAPIADVPVFVLSNLGDRSDFQRAKDLGANEYFIKAHFSLDEIVDSVKWRLQRK